MEKTVITGRIFERILEKSGFTKSGYARFLSTELKTKRTRQWVSKLILSNPHDEIPARWVNALKEMVGEEAFEKWAKSGKGNTTASLSDTGKTVFRAYSIEEYAQLRKEGRLPKTNIDAALKKIRTKWKIKMTDEEFLTLLENDK